MVTPLSPDRPPAPITEIAYIRYPVRVMLTLDTDSDRFRLSVDRWDDRAHEWREPVAVWGMLPATIVGRPLTSWPFGTPRTALAFCLDIIMNVAYPHLVVSGFPPVNIRQRAA